MVITSFPRWSKTQQVRLNTLVKFEPAEPLFGGQFSTGANNLGLQFATNACSPLAGDALAAIPSRKASPANGLLQQNCSRGPEGFLGRPINLRHSGEVPFDSRRAGRAG
jgi:hypothetical protein